MCCVGLFVVLWANLGPCLVVWGHVGSYCVGLSLALLGRLGLFRVVWGSMGPCEGIWFCLGAFGSLWGSVELRGVISGSGGLDKALFG